MSREIKFRAYDKKHGTMGRVISISRYEEIKDATEVCYYVGSKTSLQDISNIERVDVMQYTCLTDKNSIEIYEGDVVEAKTVERSPIASDYVSGYLKGVIEYYDNAFCIKYKDKKGQYIYNHLWTNAEEWRVLGNIHEHPHLMEEQQ